MKGTEHSGPKDILFTSFRNDKMAGVAKGGGSNRKDLEKYITSVEALDRALGTKSTHEGDARLYCVVTLTHKRDDEYRILTHLVSCKPKYSQNIHRSPRMSSVVRIVT